MTVIGNMYNFILINLAIPHIVAFAIGIKNIDCYVWRTHLGYKSTICPITYVDCPVLFWSVAHQWFGAFE